VPVILPDNLKQQPEPHEIEVARILTRHFRSDATFIATRIGYRLKSADLLISGVVWEIKSPIGNSKTTIENQFKAARKQSRSIVLDGRRTKRDDAILLRETTKEVVRHRSIRRLLFINKIEEVIKVR
jgi:hypothetical protein